VSNPKPIRSAQYAVNQILEGVKFETLRPRIELGSEPLHWSLFALGAEMVADRLASKEVRKELEDFEAFIGAEISRRSDEAYAAFCAEREVSL
jgi:hypothetical protein